VFAIYGTDAPIYHYPVTTIAFIVACCVVFAATLANPESMAPYALEYGNGLHPVQWVSSNFMHAGFGHLLGNMLALWSFGLVVEGKLGWWRMALVALGIGAVQCAVEQTMMLGAEEGGSLGASSIIFGLMAIALIWAPINHMDCVYIYYGFRVCEFQMTVASLVGLFVVLELAVSFFSGFAMSSQVLHLMGAGLGVGLGIALLKTKLVDCENWDAFSVWAGRHQMTRDEILENDTGYQQKRTEKIESESAGAMAQITQLLHDGEALFAYRAHEQMSRRLPDWVLPEELLLKIIHTLHKKDQWAESIKPMADYLQKFTSRQIPVRLKLAQVLLVKEENAAQALRVLAKLDADRLDAKQKDLYRKLQARAKELQRRNPYDVAEHDW